MNNITDYFGAEAAIEARLKELVTDVPAKHVFTPFSVADMMESSQPSPSIHLIYAGDIVQNSGNAAPGVSRPGLTRQPIDQRWLVVLAVRSAKAQLQDTAEIRSKAGVIIPKVLDALQGWAPVEWMRPLSRVGGPSAGYSSSFAYFPFMFEGRIIT